MPAAHLAPHHPPRTAHLHPNTPSEHHGHPSRNTATTAHLGTPPPISDTTNPSWNISECHPFRNTITTTLEHHHHPFRNTTTTRLAPPPPLSHHHHPSCNSKQHNISLYCNHDL